MYVMLLSGGSGERLWPISTKESPKQFLECINKNDRYISMLKNVYDLVNKLNCPVSVITGEKYVHMTKKQLGEVDCIVEPSKASTFPAVVLGVMNAIYKKDLKENEYIAFIPIDAKVEEDFYESLFVLENKMKELKSDIGIIGVTATKPTTAYGYIKEKNNLVECFVEKPSLENAKKMVEEGFLYNTGIIVVKIKYIKDIANKYINVESYEEFIAQYENLPKTSFDYEILEKEKNITCLRVNKKWMDIGNYSSLEKILDKQVVGKATSYNDHNTTIINKTKIPVISISNKDLLISVSDSGILVSDKKETVNLKQYISKDIELDNNTVYRKWGYYKILNQNEKSLTKLLNIGKGKQISYQFHNYRDEAWTIIKGSGSVMINEINHEVKEGDTIYIKKQDRHIVKANTDMEIIEVQLGNYLSEDDIVRLEE